MEKSCLTVKEAANILGISDATLRRKIKQGYIPAIRLPGKRHTLRLLKDTVATLVEEGQLR